MIKLIILVIIIVFIALPLYQGESVSGVVNSIGSTIESIRSGTPTWVKELVVKVFSIAFRLIQAIFRTVIDIVFEEAKKGVNDKLDQEKENITNDMIENFKDAIPESN